MIDTTGSEWREGKGRREVRKKEERNLILFILCPHFTSHAPLLPHTPHPVPALPAQDKTNKIPWAVSPTSALRQTTQTKEKKQTHQI
jgi:hypothetical protein